MGDQYFGNDSVLNGSEYDYFFHDTITTSDIIVRRWLDNHFYGSTFSLNFQNDIFDVTLGGAYHMYANAKHFGEIIWADFAGNTQIRDKYYENISDKSDINGYLKNHIDLYC